MLFSLGSLLLEIACTIHFSLPVSGDEHLRNNVMCLNLGEPILAIHGEPVSR